MSLREYIESLGLYLGPECSLPLKLCGIVTRRTSVRETMMYLRQTNGSKKNEGHQIGIITSSHTHRGILIRCGFPSTSIESGRTLSVNNRREGLETRHCSITIEL